MCDGEANRVAPQVQLRAVPAIRAAIRSVV
jgi:hypothetical protein